jgi:spoIIIJ-associated protein
LLNQILVLMGEKANVEVTEASAEAIEVEIKGDGSGILIGRHGQTLDALEYLLNRLIARQIKDAVPVIIDTEAYRARRRQQLERMALSMGERAKREHRPVSLDPMPPRDRRIIHLTLKDDPLVITRSSGSGYLRALEIAPVEDRRPRDERPTRERELERPRDREPLGQQGGFKHGQKRIV